MSMKEIREKARALKVKNYSRYSKAALIRAIQEAEGNAPCFKGISGCGECWCLWRDECQI
jgi:hypothetical protein